MENQKAGQYKFPTYGIEAETKCLPLSYNPSKMLGKEPHLHVVNYLSATTARMVVTSFAWMLSNISCITFTK